MKKADRIAMMIHNTGASVTEYRKGRESNFFVVRLGPNTWGLEKSTSGCTCGVKYADTREEIEAYIEVNGYKVVKTWMRDEQPAPEAEPAPEFSYDFLSGRYGIFKHMGGTFSNEYETDSLEEARGYLKEETEGTVKRADYAIFDRDARQYIQIRTTAKGRKAFKAENERLAAKSETPANQAESDSVAGQPAPQADMTDEERIDALFHELVPVEGKADTVAGSKTGMLIREFCPKGVEIGEKRAFADMREGGWLIKTGRDKNKPTQKAVEMGLFTVKETAIQKPSGETVTRTTPLLTGKGRQYFADFYLSKLTPAAEISVT